MAPLTILTDEDIRTLLLSLTRPDIEALQLSLAEALRIYSTGAQDETACSSNQPHRASIRLKNGSTALFMPAATCDSAGIKMVTISESGTSSRDNRGSIRREDSIANSVKSISTMSINSSTTTTSTSSTTNDAASVSTTVTTPSIASSQSTTPRGSLTLLNPSGTPRALINAEELTAFRTALAATMLLRRREQVGTITVFGAGKQAYWHIRLALILRGPDIKRVNIINRSFSRAQPLLEEFYTLQSQLSYFHGGQSSDPSSTGTAGSGTSTPSSTTTTSSTTTSNNKYSTKFSILSTEYNEYERVLKEEVRKADIILCCTPSLQPLFPAEHLTAHEGRKKGRLISAIGSYRPHMCELHPDILRQAVAPQHHHHYHKHANTAGVVVVDSLTACLKEGGEIVQAGLGPEQLVEIGELVMLKHASAANSKKSSSSRYHSGGVEKEREKEKEKHGLLSHLPSFKKEKEKEDTTNGTENINIPPMKNGNDKEQKTMKGVLEMCNAEVAAASSTGTNGEMGIEEEEKDEQIQGLMAWLTKGNVIYKSVGLGLMDVVVGGDLVTLAEERRIGTRIEDF
ncbi:MAG: 60S ribosomal protein L8B [Watsoniomyces obsoletus]|nr:MAG: 60S ribosomal protein L8B [Watsoniomyces obsoletus]